MPHKSKILSILVCFCLLFEQTGFAQVAGELDISGHIAAFRNSLIQDKFRPLHLRSLSYDNIQNNFRLLLDKGELRNPKKPDLENTTKTLLNYFFIGISLPNDTFWVNLRPDSENNIIDNELAKTDVGKILLEADLQLKKDTAKFTSPQTPEGKVYWDKLYKKAEELLGSENITIPTLTRPWIVPGEIIIRETKDTAYIYKATLKVILEQDYLKNSATYNFTDPRLKTLNEYSSELIRELIIPKLTKEVNTSKRYAPLRQVYYSLILAQWFKARFYGKGGLYSWLIDRKELQGLTSKISWSKTSYFKEYQKSFKDGEYNIKEPTYTPYGQTVRSYFSGGLSICDIPISRILPNPGVATKGIKGPTEVYGISGDEHVLSPPTENVLDASANGSNTMEDFSKIDVEINEEAPHLQVYQPKGLLKQSASSENNVSSQLPSEAKITSSEVEESHKETASSAITEDKMPQFSQMTDGLLWELMQSRIGIRDLKRWKQDNPDKTQDLEKQFNKIREIHEEIDVYLKDLHSRKRLIDGTHPRFKNIYAEIKEIVDVLLKAQGYDPSLFELYLMDTLELDAFTIAYTNKIFISLGLIKFIVENGGTKDAIAFVLAHEFRHIGQWLDDCLEGKKIAFNTEREILRHGEEYDADIQALSLMDKAGYNVKMANWFFKYYLSKDRKRGLYWKILSFQSHPPTDERIRKLEKLFIELYWTSFINDVTYFSNKAKKELEKRTFLREFQDEVINCESFQNLSDLLRKAHTLEELIFAMTVGYAMVLENNPSEVPTPEILLLFEQLLSKFVSGSRAQQAFYDFLRAGIYKKIDNYSKEKKKQIEKILEAGGSIGDPWLYAIGLDAASIQELLKIDLPPEMEIDHPGKEELGKRYSHAAHIYERIVGHISLYDNYYTFLIPRAVLELTRMFKDKPIELSAIWEDMDILGRKHLFKEQAKLLIALLEEKNIRKKIDNEKDLIKLLEYANTTFVGGYNLGWEEREFTPLFHSFLTEKRFQIRTAVIKWLKEPQPVMRDLQHLFLNNELKAYPNGILLEGKNAVDDLRLLLSLGYFTSQYLFSSLLEMETGGMGTINANVLAILAWLDKFENYHNPNPQDKVRLYEFILQALSERALKTEWTDDIYRIYADINNRLHSIPAELLRQRLEAKGISLDSAVNPFILRLIYLYDSGGILDPRDLRKLFLANTYSYNDWLTFAEYLGTIRTKIMERFALKESLKQDLFWGSYTLPMALIALWDKLGVAERLSGDDLLESPSDAARWTSSRYLPFFGEFHIFLNELARIRDLMEILSDSKETARASMTRLDFAKNLEEFLVLFDYLRYPQKNFEELLIEINKFLPKSVYRNFVLYQLFMKNILIPIFIIEGKPRDRLISMFIYKKAQPFVSSEEKFDLEFLSDIISQLNEESQQKITEAIKKITPLLLKDDDIDKLNKSLMASRIKAESQDVPLNNYEREKAQYKDVSFFEMGSPLAQLDIFIGLLNKKYLVNFIQGVGHFKDKLEEITNHFMRPSNTRDEFLKMLLDNHKVTVEDIDGVLPLFSNSSFREQYALRALEMEREVYPEKFLTIDAELERILHYFPHLSYTRDDILLQFINGKVTKPEDLEKVNKLLLQHPDNIRQKEQAQFVGAKDFIREIIKEMDAQDKKDFLLWFLRISDKKPKNLIVFEYTYKVNLDSLRENYVAKEGKYYKDVGKSAREDFIISFLYGEKGIFTDEQVSKEFLDSVFDKMLPNKHDSVFKAIYDSVFKKRQNERLEDELRKEGILLALLENLSQLESRDIKDEKIKEAKAIRIFLESIGLVGIKLGQFLSNFGYVPEHIQKELENLKDRARPLHKGVVFDTVKKIFGDFYSKFQEIGELLGSASIKCVYKVKLADGKTAVLKVKRPEVEKKVQEDIAFLQIVLEDVKTKLELEGIVLPQNLVKRIQQMILEEVDFGQEANNQKRLSENLSNRNQRFKSILKKTIFERFVSRGLPKVKTEFIIKVPNSTEIANNTLMLEEFAKGIPLSNGEALRKTGIDIEDIRTAVALELLRQMVIDGFYHADPHAGNIFVSEDGKTIYLIDLGAATEISLKNIIRLYILSGAVNGGDVTTIIKLIKSFDPKIGSEQIEKIRKDLEKIMPSQDSTVNKILKVFHALDKNNVNTPNELMSIFRLFGAASYLFEQVIDQESTSQSKLNAFLMSTLTKILSKASSPSRDKNKSASSAVEKVKEYTEKFVDEFGAPSISFGGVKELNNPKARAEIIENKIYINSLWLDKMSEDEIERVIGHEAQHTRTDFLRDEKGLKIGGLHNVEAFQGLQQHIGELYDKTIQEKGNVFAKPRSQYQENWEVLSLLRGYEVYRGQIERGLQVTTQPYEFIEAFTPKDLAFLNEDYIFEITKDFEPEVGQGTKITYEDLGYSKEPETNSDDKSVTSSSISDKKGGVDFRALPIVTQPINTHAVNLNAMPLSRLDNINLDSEWSQIRNMLNAGIIPSSERIKEYLVACCQKRGLDKVLDKVLGCIADIMRIEEERVSYTDSELRTLLVLIEAGKQESELQLGLNQIIISPKEPKLVEP